MKEIGHVFTCIAFYNASNGMLLQKFEDQNKIHSGSDSLDFLVFRKMCDDAKIG